MLSNTFILSVVILLFFSGSTLPGKYTGNCHKDEYWQIKLKADSTFNQISPGPDSYKTNGTWKVKADTLELNIRSINSFAIDTLLKNGRIPVSVNWFTKYLIKKDTLILLMNRPNSPIKKWCTLTK